MQAIAGLVTVSPGDLVYHLVTLFAIQLILGIAFGYWSRHRQDMSARRSLVAGIVFITGRLLLVAVALLESLDVVVDAGMFPPLERLVDVTVVAVTGWAFLPIALWSRRASTSLLVVVLILSAVFYGVTAALWVQADGAEVIYGQHWQGRAWAAGALVVSTLILTASLVWRGDSWSFVACLFIVWMAGFVLNIVSPTMVSHAPGWSRLANLVALPLLASLVYRRALTASPSAAEDATLGEINLVSTIRRIEDARDIDAALRLTVSAVAQAMASDVVGIGLPSTRADRSLYITALHPPTGVFLAQQELTVPYSGYPILAKSLETRRPQYAYGPRQDKGTVALYSRLGFDASGPLLIQPLETDDTLLGIMLIGNPFSQRRWSARDEQMAHAIAGAIATSLVNAGRSKPGAEAAELARARQEVLRLSDVARRLEQRLEREQKRYARVLNQVRSTRQGPEDTRGAQQISESDLAPLLEELRSRSSMIGDHAQQLQSVIPEEGDDIGRQLLQRIRVNIERLNKTLDDLGRLDVVENEELVSAPEAVDLVALARSVRSKVEPRFEEQNVHVTLQMPSSGQSVGVDKEALGRLLEDLLINAAYRSPPNSEIVISGSIEHYQAEDQDLPDYLIVSVTDRGSPVPMEVRDQVFQAPRATDSGNRRPEEEGAVDLYKTKAIVEAHGGRIWVESGTDDEGMAFRFILPLASMAKRDA